MTRASSQTYPNLKAITLACLLVVLGAIVAWQVFNWLNRDSLRQVNARFLEESQGIKDIAAGVIRNPDIPREQMGNLFVARARAWLREYHPDVTLVDGNMKPIRDNGAVWQVSYRLKDQDGTTAVQQCLGEVGENVSCR